MALVSLKPSAKGITVLIILASATLFMCILAYLGASSRIGSLALELNSKQAMANNSTQIAQTLEESRLKFLDVRAQLRCLESSVSTQSYVPTLMKQLEHLGKSVNLKVLGVRPEPTPVQPTARGLSSGAQAAEGNVSGASQASSSTSTQSRNATAAGKPTAAKTPQKPYDEMKIALELEGGYMNALDFLYRLTSFPKILAVDNVEISPVGTASAVVGSPRLTIKVKVTAFIFKDTDLPVEPAASKTPAKSAILMGGRTGNEAG